MHFGEGWFIGTIFFSSFTHAPKLVPQGWIWENMFRGTRFPFVYGMVCVIDEHGLMVDEEGQLVS